ncbi:MAG: hypothetical protein NZM38_03215 [Cytophagales bacterium]|nr:hypothetical protein [Cytophagales bacterium]MDW8383763.1 hypothetical protein [Flammeovirgaceae bacterium]
MNKIHQTTIKVPVHFSTSGNYTQLSVFPAYIKANVSATGWILMRYLWSLHQRILEIKIENPLQVRYLTKDDLMPIFVESLPEFKVHFLVTDTIRIAYDSLVRKTIRLQVDTQKIDIAEGYYLASEVRIVPDTVVIEGAKSILAEVPNILYLELEEKDIQRPYLDFLSVTLPEFPTVVPMIERVQVSFDVQPSTDSASLSKEF